MTLLERYQSLFILVAVTLGLLLGQFVDISERGKYYYILQVYVYKVNEGV